MLIYINRSYFPIITYYLLLVSRPKVNETKMSPKERQSQNILEFHGMLEIKEQLNFDIIGNELQYISRWCYKSQSIISSKVYFSRMYKPVNSHRNVENHCLLYLSMNLHAVQRHRKIEKSLTYGKLKYLRNLWNIALKTLRKNYL